jgi:hypothetical protein
MEENMSIFDSRIIDFRPAPPGWRLVYLMDGTPEGYVTAPMPGWLIQEEVYYSRQDTIDDEDTPAPANRGRSVTAAGCDGAYLFPAESAENFWRVLGPDEDDPLDEQVEEEKASRREAAS